MAGESPDRSKQRESSAEPTSGSAGTVPEARDPRVSETRGGVDTATRVFSVRELKTETDAEDSADETGTTREAEAAEEADAAEGAQEAEEAAEEPQDAAEGGDERLRAAVAQWVVSADEKSDAKDAKGDAKDADRADSSDDADSSDEPEAEAGTEDGTETEAEDDAKSEAKPASKRAPKWATANTDDADDTDDSDDQDAENADDADDADDAEESAPKADKKDKGDDSDKAEDADESDTADAPVDQPTAVFKAVRPDKPAVDQPTTMLKLGGDKAKPETKPETKPEAKPEPEAEAKPETKPEPEAERKPEPEGDEPESAAEAERTSERTSKFVALKPLDDPSTRKPKPSEPAKPDTVRPAADATAVVPQIGPERTTQQPLPPKPPLDLLAELTNTPPPPPTPMRTLARRVKIWTPLVLLLVIVFAVVQAVRPLPAPELTLTAKDSYTFAGSKLSLPWPDEGQGWMDVDGIGTMDTFGKQTPVAIGSVAKTMTAYVVLKSHPLKPGEEGPNITVDATAETEGGYYKAGESTLNSVKAGDKLSLKQALSAVMIPSANNIARLLARWDAGSEAAFVKKMNAAAKELGMTATTYTDPSGLKETTVSTAEDQVKLGNAVVKNPALVAITSAASWTDPSGTYFSNYNELPFLMGAIGIKTGSTTAAGGNLLFASRKEVGGETVTIVGAILGQHKPTILKTVNRVSRTALTAAQNALISAKTLKKGDVVGYVDDGLGGRTPVVVTEDVTRVGWAGLTTKLSFASGEVPHTAKAGTQVGTLTVGDGSGGAVKVPVALQADLVEPGFSDKLTRIG
ncbi:D-alanyl-D-alanine carboxypeptidase [Streptomyces sp. A012304]|nr:D-alanyl-D-alanine carboxypeptidase [Streptomyces sp. A012304]